MWSCCKCCVAEASDAQFEQPAVGVPHDGAKCPFEHPAVVVRSCEHPAVVAWRNKSLGLGFSGAGFLLSYFIGAYESLERMGIVSRDTPMAGASSGSLVVAAVKAGVTPEQQMDSFLEVAADCRRLGVKSRLRAALKAQLIRQLPAKAHEACSDGTTFIAISHLFPYPHNCLYSHFTSDKDLCKALLASCHLPMLSDGGMFTGFRGVHRRVYDGGFTKLLPEPPSTIMVTRTAASCKKTKPAAEPPPKSHGFGSNGALDPTAWCASAAGAASGAAQRVEFVIRVCALPTSGLHTLPAMLQAPAAADVAVALDLYQEWPHDITATSQFGLSPQDPPFLMDLQQRGRQDALSWAAAAAFPEEVLARGRALVDEGRNPQSGACEAQLPKVLADGLGGEQPRVQQQQQEAAADVSGAVVTLEVAG